MISFLRLHDIYKLLQCYGHYQAARYNREEVRGRGCIKEERGSKGKNVIQYNLLLTETDCFLDS